MNYYILAAKEDVGCPVSLVELAVLHDKYYEPKVAQKLEHGLVYPWYARNKKGVRAIGDNAVLIVKCKFVDFDIRRLISKIFIVSENFVALMAKVDLKFQDIREISLTSKLGKNISNKKYFAAIFMNSNIFDCNLYINKNFSNLEKDYRNLMYFKNIFIESVGLPDLFSFSNMNPTQDFLFCTEKFKLAGELGGIKGIEWKLSNEINWPNNPLRESLLNPIAMLHPI